MRATRRTLVQTAAWASLSSLLSSCSRPAAPVEPPPHERSPLEPLIRVRTHRQLAQVKISRPATVEIIPLDQPESAQRFRTPIQLDRIEGRWSGPWTSNRPGDRSVLQIRGLGPEAIQIENQRYPGFFHLVPQILDDSTVWERFDAVNHVDMEVYLPGVLEQELYPDWKPAAYMAQAIAARSYAIHHISRTAVGRHYDLIGSPVHQAYSGLARLGLSYQAALETRGLVLSWKNRVIPAYYSSTCGGAGLSALDAFANPAENIPPLTPEAPCPWCQSSKHYAWGPVTRDRTAFSQRLAAWGQARKTPIAAIGKIQGVEIATRNSLNRPTHFDFSDDQGRRYRLLADSLRSAANYTSSAANLAPLESSQRLKSGFVQVRLEGETLYFEEGRGLGHGVGLCQYGAQSMAANKYNTLEILQQFYPHASIDRAY